MDRHVTWTTTGVCAREIRFDLVNGIIHHVKFIGGCAGNTQGVALLAEGMKAEDVVKRLKGVNCHDGSSCPDQLAQAIEWCLAEERQGSGRQSRH